MNWISVSDRLPEGKKLVWIAIRYDGDPFNKEEIKRVSIGARVVGDGYAIWHDFLDPFPCADDFIVTHWMPIKIPRLP